METNLTEIWKTIPNSTYAISNKGKIKNTPHMRLHNINKTFYKTKEQILTPCNNNSKKYWRFTVFYNDGSKKTESIHRLVAEAFIPNINNYPYINHIDGNKDNNHAENLEWCTNQQNMDHRFGVLKCFSNTRGSACNFAKLNEEQVHQIAILLKQGNTLVNIGKQFGVGNTTISEIKSGRSWSHLNLFEYKKKKSEKYDKKELGLRYSPTNGETHANLQTVD